MFYVTWASVSFERSIYQKPEILLFIRMFAYFFGFLVLPLKAFPLLLSFIFFAYCVNTVGNTMCSMLKGEKKW